MDEKIFLIDSLRRFRETHSNLTIARTSDEALETLKRNEEWGEIWLGDLRGAGEETEDPMIEVIDYFTDPLNEPVRVATIVIHTSNPDVASRILNDLLRSGYEDCVRVYADDYLFVEND